MKSISSREWTLLGVILVFSFIPTFGGLFRVIEIAGGSALLPANPRALTYPLPVVTHIVASFIFCIAGALQFLPTFRVHQPTAHRVIGRVVAAAGLVSAASGLWMTQFFVFPENLQGSSLYATRILLGFSMMILIGWALIAIRSRNVFQHSAAMLRAYAIGQGASTQAFFGIGWIVVLGAEPAGPLRDALMIYAWILNLLVAEVIIRRRLAPRTVTAMR